MNKLRIQIQMHLIIIYPSIGYNYISNTPKLKNLISRLEAVYVLKSGCFECIICHYLISGNLVKMSSEYYVVKMIKANYGRDRKI